jgi:hypothetical protein
VEGLNMDENNIKISNFMVFKGDKEDSKPVINLTRNCYEWSRKGNEDWDYYKISEETKVIISWCQNRYLFINSFRKAISRAIRLIHFLKDYERVKVYRFYEFDEETKAKNVYIMGEVKIFRDGTCVWTRNDSGGILVYNKSDDWSITTNFGPPAREPKYSLAMLDRLYSYPSDFLNDKYNEKYKRPYDQYCTERNDKDGNLEYILRSGCEVKIYTYQCPECKVIEDDELDGDQKYEQDIPWPL